MTALAGLKVLELSRVLAGPWAAQLLADLGAEVIKVERPHVGDDTRAWGPPWFTDEAGRVTGESAYFMSTNRNKRSVAIDVTTPDGAEAVRALAKDADVLIENFKTGGLRTYGLDYPALQLINTRLIYCSITGFGHTGPRASQPGYDALIQAMGGLMSVTGAPDAAGGSPVKVGVAVVDIMTGLYAAAGVLAALEERRRSDQGQHIDLALFDVQLATLANQALNQLVTGVSPERMGNAHPSIVPYQDLPTSDGAMMVAVGNDAQFRRFCQALALPELADHPDYARNSDRVANRVALVARLASVTRSRTTRAWVDALTALDVPCGPINSIGQAFADPQAVARGAVLSLAHPEGGVRPGVDNPLRFSRTPVVHRASAPALGGAGAEAGFTSPISASASAR